VQDTDMLTMED